MLFIFLSFTLFTISNAFHMTSVYKNTNSFKMISTSEDPDVETSLVPSKDEDVMRKILYTPSFVPTLDQSKTIFNNMKYLYDAKNKAAMVFDKLKRLEVLGGYKLMQVDHPLAEVDLADTEKLFLQHPNVIEKLTGVEISAFEFSNVPTPTTQGLKRVVFDIKPAATLAAVLSALSYGLSECGVDVASLALPALVSAGVLTVADGPVFLNGLLRRSAGWVQAMLAYHTLPSVKDTQERHAAAAIVVAYLTGLPILSVNIDPSEQVGRQRTVHPDAPRVEVSDATMAVLGGSGRLDLRSLQRTVSFQTAGMAADLLEGRKATVTGHLRMLLAGLFERANSVDHSTMTEADFSVYIVPMLFRWGLVNSLLILKESQDIYTAVLEAIHRGADVGECIIAIEATLTPSHPAFSRQRDRVAKEVADAATAKAAVKPRSYSDVLSLILRAKGTPTPVVDAHLPHELIPGTDRIYTREELILRPNPSVMDIQRLTQELMTMRIALDRDANGRVPQQTKTYIHQLAADVNEALQLTAEGKSARGMPSLDGLEEEMNTHRPFLLEDSGLAEDQIPPTLKEGLPAQAYEECLVELFAVNKVLATELGKWSYWWTYVGKPVIGRVTGADTRTAIDHAWRAVKSITPSTQGPSAPAVPTAPFMAPQNELRKVAELRAILAKLTFDKEISGEMSTDDSLPTEMESALFDMFKSAIARAPSPFDSLSDHAGGAYNDLQDLEDSVISRMQEVDATLATKKV